MAMYSSTSGGRFERPLHPTSSSMTYSEYMTRHRLRTSPKQHRPRFDPPPGDSPRVIFPDFMEDEWIAKFNRPLAPAGHSSCEETVRRLSGRDLPTTSRHGHSARWTSHSATEARPKPLKSALKKPKARKSEFNLSTILWEINRPKPKGKTVTFAPDVKQGDDDTAGKVINPKLFKCISPPGKVYPPTPGRTVDEILADISYDYADLYRGNRFSSYAFDPEVRTYLISRMQTAREKVAAAYEKDERHSLAKF